MFGNEDERSTEKKQDEDTQQDKSEEQREPVAEKDEAEGVDVKKEEPSGPKEAVEKQQAELDVTVKEEEKKPAEEEEKGSVSEPEDKVTGDASDDFDRQALEDKLLKEFDAGDSGPEALYKIFLRPKLLVPLLVVCVVGFLSYAWYTDKFAISSTDANVPYVKADKEPVRVNPEDPGGMEIPNLEMEVLHHVGGASAKRLRKLPKVEQILPKPEAVAEGESASSGGGATKDSELKVAAKEEVTKSSQQAVESEKTKNAADKVKEEKPKAEEAKSDAKEEMKKAEEKPSSQVEKAKEEVKKAEEKTKKIVPENAREVKPEDIKTLPENKKKPVVEEKPVSAVGYKIQLGAFRSEAEVDENWAKLKKKFPEELGKLQHYKERADLGDKGVFYRLKAGPIANETEGRSICKKLEEKKQGCFFVKK